MSETCCSLESLVQPPVFVIGVARSGTTWVYDILTSHPRVAGVFESWLFTDWAGCAPLFNPIHWSETSNGLGALVSRDELLTWMRRVVLRTMARSLGPQHQFLVEKSPGHQRAVPIIEEFFPGARFVHVLRDGQDVSVSVRSAVKSWAPGWSQHFGRSLGASARHWMQEVTQTRSMSSHLAERYFEIRYESIRADPISAYRRLYDFCGIPYDEATLNSVFAETDFARNYTPRETAFRRGGRVGDWRTCFSLRDALVFNRIAGDTLVELDYERTRVWLPNPSAWFGRR